MVFGCLWVMFRCVCVVCVCAVRAVGFHPPLRRHPRKKKTNTQQPTKNKHKTQQTEKVTTDVGSNPTAQYITGMVRGATRGLTIDIAILLEGQQPCELPEALLGAARCVLFVCVCVCVCSVGVC